MTARWSIALPVGVALALAGAALWMARSGTQPEPAPTTLRPPPPPSHRVPRTTLRLPVTSPGVSDPTATGPMSTTLPFKNLASAIEQAGKLTRAEIETYLWQTKRSAGSLLAAYWLTHDMDLLREAAKRFPDDPQVQLAVLAWDAFPEERARWLQAFAQTAPNNALANYLAAAGYFKDGKPEQAIAELRAAVKKTEFSMYWRELAQSLVDGYLAAGFGEADADILGFFSAPLPAVASLRELSQQTIDLANQYRLAGDALAANSLAGLALNMGEKLGASADNKMLITELVRLTLERNALQVLMPAAVPDSTGAMPSGSVRLANIDARLAAIKELTQGTEVEQAVARMSDADIVEYFRRVQADGEYQALLWLRDKLAGR